jgi:tetratricopeptide (TPR) repeat protein
LSTLANEELVATAAQRSSLPAKLNRLLRGDLDWIVMKALEKDRNRRYESASALAADSARHLANEPIEARPPTLADRAAKWARRHRPLVGAAAVSLGIILAILASSTFLVLAAYQGEKEQRGAAEANAKKAEDSAAMAAKNYEAARQAVQHMVTRVADEDLARIPEMKEVRRRLLEDAAGFYTKLTELNPRDPRAYYERGGVYFLLQQYGKVRWDYEKAIELDPNNPEFHGALGGFSGGCPDVAFRDLKCALLHTNWALRLDPQNLRYHHDLAQLYFRSGEKDKAVAEMRKTAEMCDTDARRMTLYASASNMAGDVKGGLEWQKKAVGFAPDNPGLHEWLAKFYFALGENENAVAAATKAIALGNKARSDSADNLAFYRYVTRGDIYAAMGMYREALADYDKAAELAGFRSYTYKRRAVVHFHLKHYDRALADIAKSLELAPWDASALTWIPPEQVAKCPDELFRKGLADLADKTVENSKGGAEATGARARLYVALGQADKIIAECREAIRREPRNAKAHEQLGNVAIAANNRAWCLATSADLRLRQPAEALELAKKAVAIAPGTCSFLNTLGVAQYRAGDHKGAIESLEKSLALGARALNSVFLAMAHWQLGHKDEARSWYDKAAEWMEKEKPRNAEEFLRFRAEAAELLGIPEKPPPERTTPGKSK